MGASSYVCKSWRGKTGRGVGGTFRWTGYKELLKKQKLNFEFILTYHQFLQVAVFLFLLLTFLFMLTNVVDVLLSNTDAKQKRWFNPFKAILLCKDRSFNLQFKSIEYFLYDENTDLRWSEKPCVEVSHRRIVFLLVKLQAYS